MTIVFAQANGETGAGTATTTTTTTIDQRNSFTCVDQQEKSIPCDPVQSPQDEVLVCTLSCLHMAALHVPLAPDLVRVQPDQNSGTTRVHADVRLGTRRYHPSSEYCAGNASSNNDNENCHTLPSKPGAAFGMVWEGGVPYSVPRP